MADARCGNPFWLAYGHFYARFLGLVGVVAQLVERLVRNEEVRGSTPLGSTSLRPLQSKEECCRAEALSAKAGR
jgi:hypothetical protein